MTKQTHGSTTMQGCAVRIRLALLGAHSKATWAPRPVTKVVVK
jgi:hypothetical protein